MPKRRRNQVPTLLAAATIPASGRAPRTYTCGRSLRLTTAGRVSALPIFAILQSPFAGTQYIPSQPRCHHLSTFTSTGPSPISSSSYSSRISDLSCNTSISTVLLILPNEDRSSKPRHGLTRAGEYFASVVFSPHHFPVLPLSFGTSWT